MFPNWITLLQGTLKMILRPLGTLSLASLKAARAETDRSLVLAS